MGVCLMCFDADLFVDVYVVFVWFGSCWLLLIDCLLRRLVRWFGGWVLSFCVVWVVVYVRLVLC